MTQIKFAQPTTIALATLLLVPTATYSVTVVRNVGGSDPASILAEVNAFRADLGGVNNGVGGTFLTGRREIN